MTCERLRAVNAHTLSSLPLHHLGADKWAALSRPYPLAGMPAYPRDKAERVRDDLLSMGISVCLADDLGAFSESE